MKERNIALCIIFSIITCGIYAIYWLVQLNKEISQLSGTEPDNAALVVILTIVTCGIYGWYWCFKMGQKVNTIKGEDNNHIIYIVLAILELSIVNYALMQDTINKHIGDAAPGSTATEI